MGETRGSTEAVRAVRIRKLAIVAAWNGASRIKPAQQFCRYRERIFFVR
jgi:hypothetical protein